MLVLGVGAGPAAAERARALALQGATARPADATPASPRPDAEPASPRPDAEPASPSPSAEPAEASLAGEDIDLAALGIDPGAPSFDDQLNIFGFASLLYTAGHWSKPVSIAPQDSRTFALGNLNLYLAKNIALKSRVLAEVRFTFLPNASQDLLTGRTVSTTATDASDYFRELQWGAVIVERAYVEHDLTSFLTVRAGHWLTPYGIWNIDHGSPAIISAQRPYIVGAQFFPEHQTGLDAFGTLASDSVKLSYHLTASNGRGGAEAQFDQDGKLAFGARAEVEFLGALRFGGSYYRGRYTGLPAMVGGPTETYLEESYGVDALFERGGLRIQSEVMARDVRYPGQGIPTPTGLVTARQDFGFYGIAGYRFAWPLNPMPFGYYEDYRPGDHTLFTSASGVAAGINFRPSASLVVKVMGRLISISGGAVLPDVDLRELTGEISWVF